MILVTTAGKVGAEAARVLARRGTPVRVLVRSQEKAAALAADGVEVVLGDLERPDSVAHALRGVSSVVLVSPAVPAHELRVLDAAARAGVEHVVKITSKASADSPIVRRRDQAEIEDALVASGIGYTLLRNNAYMQNLFMLAPGIAGSGEILSSAGEGRVGFVDSRDVAAVAARVAADPGAHVGRTYWPSGPEALSYADVAGLMSRALGRPVAFRRLTFAEEKQLMVDAGLPEGVAEMNAQALGLFAQGDSEWVTDDVARILGRPAGTFDQFVLDHLDRFS